MPYPTYPSVDVPAVPTPRLEHYLDFWESERDAARSAQSPAWGSTPYHAEWDINVPVPRQRFFAPGGRDFLSFAGLEVQSRELRAWSAGSGLPIAPQASAPVFERSAQADPRLSVAEYVRGYRDGCGFARAGGNPAWGPHGDSDYIRGFRAGSAACRGLHKKGFSGLGTVGQPLGQDPTALVNLQAGTMLVSATWAQRAANAFRPAGAAPIQVDGIVGPATISALRRAELAWHAYTTRTLLQPDTGQTSVAPGIPMPTRSGAGVAIPVEFGNYLARLVQVADPPRTSPTPPTSPLAPPPPAPAPDPATSPPTSSGSSGGGAMLALLAISIGAYAYSR